MASYVAVKLYGPGHVGAFSYIAGFPERLCTLVRHRLRSAAMPPAQLRDRFGLTCPSLERVRS